MDITNVATIGFGEAAKALVTGWRTDLPHLRVVSFDIKTESENPDVVTDKKRDYEEFSVAGSQSLEGVMSQSTIIFSLVTSDQALIAARAAAEHIQSGSFYFDCNICTPETKRAAARRIGSAGGCYIDSAIMSSVLPQSHKTPLLISGVKTQQALQILTQLGMNGRIIDGEVGRASSIKLMRSVIIKGIEALTLECMLAARKAGVETEVLKSLDASEPEFNWFGRAEYNMERATTHGVRRAAEMREVIKAVEEIDLPARMARSIVDWQQQAGGLGLKLEDGDYQSYADTILSAIGSKNP